MTRQEVIDAMGEEHILGLHPRREWLIAQIMLLVDARAETVAQEAIRVLMRREVRHTP